MRGLEHHLVARQREPRLDQVLRLGLVIGEMPEQHFAIGLLEVVGRLLDLILVVDVAVRHTRRPGQIEHVFHVLQIHGEALDAVGDFPGDRFAVDSADLLEVGELRHFHAVQPHLPAQAPGTQGRILPVVLDEADVVRLGIDAQGFERTDIEIDDVRRRRLEHHLILVIVLQAVGVFAVAPVLGAARGLHIGGAPGLGAKGAQEGGGVRGAGAHFHVVGLQERAALPVPIGLQPEDKFLEGGHGLPMLGKA